MFDARQIRRTMLLAGALAACAAPAASARPADESSYAKPSTSARSDTPKTQRAPGLGESAARREAVATRQWQTANRASVAPVPESGNDGLSWPSAAIGAAVPLTFVLFGVIGHALLAHRRRGAGGGVGPTASTSA